MKTTTETIYTCEKCGATFFFEGACKAHEQECDGVARGRRLAEELGKEIDRLRFEEGMNIETELGHKVCEAVYDDENRRIVLTSF